MAASDLSDMFNVREADATILTSGQPTEAQLESVARSGVQVVVNLAPHDGPRALADEAGCAAALGMDYVHIPVPFSAPSHADLIAFFDAMDANRTRRMLVHCAANKRVTAFLGLYRVIRLGWTADDAFALMRTVWEPDAVWSRFIAAAMGAHFAGGQPVMSTSTPASVFLERSRYFLGTEYLTKLRRAIEALPADKTWWRADEQSNSVGNLLLHLNGNVRQWIVRGVGRSDGSRDRAGEFSARNGPLAAPLMADLERTLGEVDGILASLTPDNLLESRSIQGRDLTVLEAIYHVVEHFSFHLGQIVLLVKLHAPGAIAFYEDAGGLARPVWHDAIRK
jgi:protein tyrosine phosphatase (PTP) superfamily phosphohydrolase (DUF442 family)/uncharacterized damage-inducible protein DinB